ncbi:MAG: hypothetical protein WC047_07655 [Kiritimatiellales bacterium]
MNRLIALATLAAVCTTFAADDPFADFAALEADAAKAAAKPEAGAFGKLGENLSGKAIMQYTAFFNDRQKQTGSDNKNHFWDTVLELNTWTGGNDWRIDVSGWMQAGNQDHTFSGVSPDAGALFRDTDDQDHRYLTLNELYLTLNFNSWDLTLGKKIFKNGLSAIYSPADKLRPVAGYDPLNVRDLGIWQVRADFYRNQTTWTFAVLPVYQPDKVPHTSSRWVNAPAGPSPASDYPDMDPKDFGWFVRGKTVKNGWDLFASLYTGPGRQYVMENRGTLLAPVLVRRVPGVINPAAGYSTTRGRWEFHGEAAYTDAYRNDDQDYISVVQGTTLTIDGDRVSDLGLEQILATFEAAWEWTTDRQTAANYITDSDSTRAGQSDLITRLQFKVNEDLSFEYNSHIILGKWGYANRFGGSWKFMNNLTWRTGVEFFGGKSGGGPAAGLNNLGVNYGGWKRNNRLVTSLEYEF